MGRLEAGVSKPPNRRSRGWNSPDIDGVRVALSSVPLERPEGILLTSWEGGSRTWVSHSRSWMGAPLSTRGDAKGGA